MNIHAISRHPSLRVRHETRTRLLEVARAEILTPHMRRIVLTGEALDGFTSLAADDHIKLFLPAAGQDRPILPTLGSNGPVFPEGALRPIARDYTPRRFDAAARELTIDFVLHGEGPAASWAARAKPGQIVGIGGPRGSFLAPDDFGCYLLAGDETALPAIARRLEELPTGSRAIVLVEIASLEEQIYLPSAASLSVTWLPRNSRTGRTGLLLQALQGLSWPSDEIFAWLAGELSVIRELRAHLLTVRGLDSSRIRASGYWRHGAASSHEQIED